MKFFVFELKRKQKIMACKNAHMKRVQVRQLNDFQLSC